ncbi:hypothetical protein HZB01_02805 [Candidatus Woesearchaeota archaeon]|nr:hypothetical protein [Candidatus Woesearchaeota archaeon]
MLTRQKVHSFDAQLISFRRLSISTGHFTVSVPQEFVFYAGQFVSFIIKKEDGTSLRRPYSIASAPPANGQIDLCIKKVEGGIGTTMLFALQEGESMPALGPMGAFGVQEAHKVGDLCFISTGAGIAPFKSIIPDLLKNGFSKSVFLFSGFKNEQEILYQEEFSALAEQYSNFHYFHAVDSPIDKNYIPKGRVQDLVKKYLPPGFSGHFYLCGLWAMIEDVGKLLAAKGVTSQRIHFERYD